MKKDSVLSSGMKAALGIFQVFFIMVTKGYGNVHLASLRCATFQPLEKVASFVAVAQKL